MTWDISASQILSPHRKSNPKCTAGVFYKAGLKLVAILDSSMLSLRIGQNVNTLWNNLIQVCIAYFNTVSPSHSGFLKHSIDYILLNPIKSKRITGIPAIWHSILAVQPDPCTSS